MNGMALVRILLANLAVYVGASIVALCIIIGAPYATGAQAAPGGGSTPCDMKYDSCMAQPGASQQVCLTVWRTCVSATCLTPPAAGKLTESKQCNQIPDCQTYCTEAGTGAGGLISCCQGGPQIAPHQPNPCKDMVDGKCNPQKEDGKGGQPPQMPQIPQPKPKQPGQESQDPCAEKQRLSGATVEANPLCAGQESSISDTLTNAFGSGSGSTGDDLLNLVNGGSSAADELESLAGDGSQQDSGSEGSSQNASSDAIPFVRQADTVSVQPVSNQTNGAGGSASGQNGSMSGTETGFSSAPLGDTQSTTVLGQIKQTISNIADTVSRLMSQWFSF